MVSISKLFLKVIMANSQYVLVYKCHVYAMFYDFWILLDPIIVKSAYLLKSLERKSFYFVPVRCSWPHIKPPSFSLLIWSRKDHCRLHFLLRFPTQWLYNWWQENQHQAYQSLGWNLCFLNRKPKTRVHDFKMILSRCCNDTMCKMTGGKAVATKKIPAHSSEILLWIFFGKPQKVTVPYSVSCQCNAQIMALLLLAATPHYLLLEQPLHSILSLYFTILFYLLVDF